MTIRDVSIAMMIALSSLVAAQGDQPRPTLSPDPLTSDQVAVYRAFLDHYLKDTRSAILVAAKTAPLDAIDRGLGDACMKEIKVSHVPGQGVAIHELNGAFAQDTRLVLVDGDRHRDEPGDPYKALINGLFTMSEILFDEGHRQALVSYGYVCGGLCGQGAVLLLTKTGDIWKVSKTCGSWVS